MSLTFLAYQNEGSQFNRTALDKVMAHGDSLYVGIKQQLILDKTFQGNHLTLEEMPKQVLTDTNMYNVKMSFARLGPLKAQAPSPGSEQWGQSLATQLECLSAEVSQALIVVSPECIAVFRDKSGRYGVFDSHTRNAAGIPHHYGTAIMMTFSELSDLADHLHKVFKCRGADATYEFVPISFDAVSSSEHCQPLADSTKDTQSETLPCTPQAEVPTADINVSSAPQVVPQTADINVSSAPQVVPQTADINFSSAPQVVPQTASVSKLNTQRRQKARRKASASKDQRERKRKSSTEYDRNKYASCPEFRMKKVQAVKTTYARKSHHQQRLLSFKRYYSDPQVHTKKKETNIGRYRTDPTFQNKQKKSITDRYRTDPAFQSKQKKRITDRYRTDPAFQSKQKKRITDRYRTDPAFQSKQKKRITERYRTDPAFQSKQKKRIAYSYRTDPAFRDKLKKNMSDRYRTDPTFRSRQKMCMKTHYASNQSYRQKKMQSLNLKYHNDPEFRQRCIQRVSQKRLTKLATNAAFCIHHKIQKALRIRRKYRHIVTHHQEPPQALMDPVMEAAIASFRETIRHGPTYVCTVCNRTMFPNQVKLCKRGKYSKHNKMAATCLTGNYVHVCDDDCTSPCSVPQERVQEWICHTCDNHLSRGRMPSTAVANNLELAPIPPELAILNVLERQLIAKILPFAKIIALPKGQQRAVHGAVVCVPSEMETVVNSLPRPNAEAQLLQVKLKRRIKYKGHQHFYTVNMKNVLAGLAKLKQLHSEYKDVSIDDSATYESLQDDEEDSQHNTAVAAQPEQHSTPEQQSDTEKNMEADIDLEELFNSQNEPDQSNVAAQTEQSDKEADKEKEELRPGLALDTCMQPPDIAQEILSYGDGIFSIAPAQGNKPVGFFTIPKLEAMAFPVQFPTGQNTLDEVRKVQLSPSMYFNARLFAADTRFASDQSYLFFAQFVTETHLATSSMSIQMRKGKSKSKDGRRVNNWMLQDKVELERLIMDKDATRFMQPLRGTPAYWEKTLRDVHAMVRQIGKPTFFLTFSAAEMRWPEIVEVIKAQQGELGDFSELDWNAKCDILRSNPITVMRMFEKRVDALMTSLILSPAKPIGEVEDYFYRVEFQARGSPHIHMLVWIKDAPEFEDDPDSVVVKFIDEYISCKMPDPERDPELHKIVSEVQMHSRKHSKSCKKGNVSCRFGFPKLPMEKTIITRPPTVDSNSDENPDPAAQLKAQKRQLLKMQREAKSKLQPLRELLMQPDASFSSFSDMLRQCNMTEQEYLIHVTNLTSHYVVMLKRDPNDCWINGYNPDLLRAWNANMDIQYVVDDFSCIMYMMSYVSKPEHEMTEFLNSVIKTVKKSKVNERDEMKQIMQAYAKHREVSAQEAAARTCSLPLKKCSRSVVFLQTDEDGLKMSHPINRLKNMEPDSEAVWMSGVPEKYLDRPVGRPFEGMCLAEFASEYRVVYGQQAESKSAIPLLHDKGFIQKRTVGKPAIIRFARFSEKKTPEKFYRRLLKLYLSHRSDGELTDEQYPTYEQFYKCAKRGYCDIRCIVDANKKRYEGGGKNIDAALQQFQQCGAVLNAWNTFAPEVELDRLECLAEREPLETEREEDEDIPDYEADNDRRGFMPIIDAPELSPDYMRKMYQSLNETQASIFYSVRQWCFKCVWGHDPDPFYYFMTGGAGCGKSHVIKCIHQEATRILRELPRFRDRADMSQPAVLLTAFTGTAAFNISGKTLHSILKLPRSLKPPYQGLGNALDEVRAALSNAEILIIDEISMVSKDLFAYVHWRFQQIKGNRKPFGGMSVLAVGDFYQLPPLGRAKPLCVYEENEFDLWKDYFTMVNLTEIMRQKDDRAFAELLNRLRVKLKGDRLSDADRQLLTQAVADGKDCPAGVLHIYATNKEVDHHNAVTVAALHKNVVKIAAQDFRKDPRTGCMMNLPDNFQGSKRDLPDNIMAAQGVRVMLTRNLDVEDGIVNGTFGTIENIVMSERGPTAARLIGLRLDNPTAGQRFRKKILGPSDDSVYIERSEESTSRRGVIRRQFPMKLAFACTAHKVQGMTMTSAVVCLKRVFERGMAYVALSRTTSLQGLTITDFDEKKIYADPEIKTALESMNHASFQSARPLLTLFKSMDQTPKTLTIIHHNTQGLPSHIVDLKAHHELRLADVLCLTETHLSGSSVSSVFQLEGYDMFARSRQVSYNTCVDMAKKDGGGVAVYCRSDVQAEPRRYMQDVTDLEFVSVIIEAPVKVLLVTVYKPPNFSLGKFLPNMKSLLDSLELINHGPIVVCGDLNEDLLSKGKKSIRDLFQSRGYTQLITVSTTEKNTLIDHIYISHPDKCLHSGVLETYYSYHSPVYCTLTG
ncbi:ATP-dependent DNA helicase PIF1 [Merluccius polli]|uniref:ATP-dependent DNA helicase n=1 Tax=Merluccius polli TaxID=89951 RepID=A0AA47N3X0_MERPO|nr:ATP-dependent DNA helicase PIF1 [Merluccius polli]